MLTMDDVDSNVNWNDLCFLISHLMHEVKRRGKEGFLNFYSENIEDFRRDWSKVDFCFLLGLMGYLDKNFEYDKNMKLDKYILDPYVYDDIFVFEENVDLDIQFNKSLNSFKERGFLFDTVDDAV